MFNDFFPIIDTCLSCEDMVGKMLCNDAQMTIFGDFCVAHFHRNACRTFQTCILNSHQGHIMCLSMVDIQYSTADVRQGKKKKERKKKKFNS